mgnify:CR=1 FL=1
MTPSARIAGLEDLLGNVLSARIPMDITAGDWFRNKKYIGSKDRAEIAARLYRIIRHKARYGWWIEKYLLEKTARNFILVDCVFHDEAAAERLFSGGGQYAATPLNEKETDFLNALSKEKSITPKEMPIETALEVPDWADAKLKDRFGDKFKAEMRAMLEGASLDLRVNTVLSTIDQAKESLEKGTEMSSKVIQQIGARL